jgi:peptide/nickel transport system substrate-binding protein
MASSVRTASLFFLAFLAFAETPWETGRFGGELRVALRAEPKTFNPVIALDAASRDIIRRTTADLITINRETQQTEPALAESWTVSKDGLHYTLTLRDGVKFSDGQPFTADDVVFSWQVYLDEKSASPQRDLLIVGDKPITAVRLDARRVRFDFAAPYAAAERLFDSVAMLPKHLLEQPFREGRIAQIWNTATPPAQMAGLGPFRLRECKPGEYVLLERNPYYWKRDASGRALPYLDDIRFLSVANEDSQVLRFAAGDTNVLSRVSARAAALLPAGTASDIGPGLEYNFLFFNLAADNKPWFRNTAFRQAVSAAIDREAMVRLVYSGHASALATHVAPGNKQWVNAAIPKQARSLDRARILLREGGFRWGADASLLDPAGQKIEFSLITTAGNDDRLKMATILQEDLRQLGITVNIAPLEQRSLIDRVTHTHQFEACILALGGGDADPNSEMAVWLSSGAMHLWNPEQKSPATEWERELDFLMQKQLSELNPAARKKLFDRVQDIEAAQRPLISLVSPNVIVASHNIGNFRPAVLDHYTLWNAEYLFLKDPRSR